MSGDFSALLASSSKVLSSAQQSQSHTSFGTPGGVDAVGNTNSGSTSASGGSFGFGSSVTPALKRSLRELSAASSHLGLGSGTNSSTVLPGVGGGYTNSLISTSNDLSTQRINSNYEASAQRLLAREGGGFDAARLGRSARQLELMGTPGKLAGSSGAGGSDPSTSAASMARTPYGVRSGLLRASAGEDGGTPLDGTSGVGGDIVNGNGAIGATGVARGEDLESYLKRRHDQSLSAILTRQRQATYSAAEDLIRKRMERELKKDSDFILRDLAGYRIHEPATTDNINVNLGSSQSSYSYEDSDMAIMDPQNPHFPPYQYQHAPQNSSSIAAAYGAGSKLSESARRHASVIATLNAQTEIQNANHGSLANDLLNDLKNLAHNLNSSSINAANTAYLNAIKLIRSVIQHNQFSKSNPSISKDLVVKYRAEGILAYLCQQFRSHIVDRVRSASLAGQTFQSSAKSNLTGFSKDVASFVELEMGVGLNNSSLASSLLWPKLYFCLRCGDAKAALETLQSANTSESEQQLLVSLITPLAQHQSMHGGASLWEVSERKSNPSIPTAISSSLKKNLSDVYHRARARSSSNTNSMDHYKLAVLALLSLVEMPNSILSISGIVNTIEDYLFCTLWDAVQNPIVESTLPSSYGAASTTTNTADSTSYSCKDKLTKLGKLIKHWGAEHFQAENDVSGWAYAMPLLASQQFQTAIVHLADIGAQRKNGLIHATHLGILLDSAGVGMDDLILEEDKMAEGASAQLLTNLLVSYSSTFQQVDPEAALEYLVRVPNKVKKNYGSMNIGDEAVKQITRLILDTRAFELLAGSIAPDGSRAGNKASISNSSSKRGGGALDAHFSSSQVSSILTGAAESAMREGNMRDAAELLALAGRYSDLLTLMNKELGSHLVVDGEQQKEQREFWKNVSYQFYHAYLAQGRTHVQEVLEAEDSMFLISTFHLLMNLTEFFNRCVDHKWEEAWSIIDHLKVIPPSEKDMSFYIESYHSLDDSIKKSFHHVVLAGMESLFQQYTQLKSNLTYVASSTGAVEQRLNEIKYRGRVLVTFAGLIQMHDSGNIHSRIAKMEAFMM